MATMAENKPISEVEVTGNQSPTFGIAQHILDRVITTRKRAGLLIRPIYKTGSKLEIIDSESYQGLARNKEVPGHSVAIWEFLDQYAGQVFPKEYAQKLFGEQGKPMVAPILNRRDGTSRTHYGDGFDTTVLSKLVGFNSPQLEEHWHLSNLTTTYFWEYLPMGGAGFYFWWNTVAYQIAKDITAQLPELDGTGELLQRYEEYWTEFEAINADALKKDSDQLRERKIEWEKIRGNTQLHTNLALIEKSRAITTLVKTKIAEVAATNPQAEWQGVLVLNVLYMLLHYSQTATQESIMWWLGIDHGHMHEGNTVSREIDDPSHPNFPLETRIIDFDYAKILPARLIRNDELYQNIDADAVVALLGSPKLKQPAKLQLLAYLPVSRWQKEHLDLINPDSFNLSTEAVLSVVAGRIEKENVSTAMLIEIFHLFFKADAKLSFGGRSQKVQSRSLQLLKSKAEQLRDTAELGPVVKYLEHGFEAVAIDTLSRIQQTLIVADIHEKASMHAQYDSSVENDELLAKHPSGETRPEVV